MQKYKLIFVLMLLALAVKQHLGSLTYTFILTEI